MCIFVDKCLKLKLKLVRNGSTEKGGGRGGGGEGGGGSSLPSDQNSPSNAGKGTNRMKIPKNLKKNQTN